MVNGSSQPAANNLAANFMCVIILTVKVLSSNVIRTSAAKYSTQQSRID